MVGKSNLKPDFDKSSAQKGAAMTSPGLNALDQEREASMADEGGTSGAEMESQEPGEFESRPLQPGLAREIPRRYQQRDLRGKLKSFRPSSYVIVGCVGLIFGASIGSIILSTRAKRRSLA